MTDRGAAGKGGAMSRLSDYVQYLSDYGSEFGWKDRFEKNICDNKDRIAYFAGYYSSMLDELINLIGPIRILNLISANDEIDRLLTEKPERIESNE